MVSGKRRLRLSFFNGRKTVELDREELAWAGGLFEGEGCFSVNRDKRGRGYIYPVAAVEMTDEDSVRRFAAAVGFGVVNGPYAHWAKKQSWRWQAFGFERTQALLAMLWPWLGIRRRAKGAEVLKCVS
jgi:hypothetical protein